jgi:uncharacterized membrane protein
MDDAHDVFESSHFRGQIMSQERAREFSSRTIRRFIVSTFEATCVAIVVVPTGIAAIVALQTNTAGMGLLMTVVIFILTSFLSGGALTLVEIGRNMQAVVDMLQRMQADNHLHRIADDVHRIEEADRTARNEAAVSAAVASTGSG